VEEKDKGREEEGLPPRCPDCEGHGSISEERFVVCPSCFGRGTLGGSDPAERREAWKATGR